MVIKPDSETFSNTLEKKVNQFLVWECPEVNEPGRDFEGSYDKAGFWWD